MRRSARSADVGGGAKRYVVSYRNDPSPEQGPEGDFRRVQLLQTLASQLELTNCGPAPFQRLRIYYDGSAWATELEATVREAP